LSKDATPSIPKVDHVKTPASKTLTASQQVDKMIRETADWRGDVLAKLRKLILATDKEIVEDWKWMGTPTYYKDGLIGVMNPHKGKVKITFEYGAAFKDPDKLFNAGLEGNRRRAIDFLEGDKINERAIKALLKEALAYNASKAKAKK
jgi:hypothetical protein